MQNAKERRAVGRRPRWVPEREEVGVGESRRLLLSLSLSLSLSGLRKAWDSSDVIERFLANRRNVVVRVHEW
jgi:hypothetical protein